MNQMLETSEPTSLPKRTTPTWEMELLISGALAFALLQIPALLDNSIVATLSQTRSNLLGTLLGMLLWFVKAALITLIATFIVHIASRAYWIGLVGLHSIFPEGIDGKKLKLGFHLSQILKKENSDASAKIERIDNLSTVVFAVGIGLVFTFAPIVIGVSLTLCISATVEYFNPGSDISIYLFLAYGVLALVFSILITFIDTRIAYRLRNIRWLNHTLRFLTNISWKLGMNSVGNGLTAYLFAAQKRPFITKAFMGVCAIFAMLLAGITIPELNLPSVPNGHNNEISNDHYADLRQEAPHISLRPFISSRVQTGPYLEVTLPFTSRRPPSSVEACSRHRYASDTAACLMQTQLLLDGKPLNADWLEQVAVSHKSTSLTALVDIRKLPKGQHQLMVLYPANAEDPKLRWQERIYFWN
jgi:hypothetical protein